MTEEMKALEILYDQALDSDELSWDTEVLDNAQHTLHQALKRNEPMKIKYIKDINIYLCGECGNPINKHNNYCSICGQRLDWTKEETKRIKGGMR